MWLNIFFIFKECNYSKPKMFRDCAAPCLTFPASNKMHKIGLIFSAASSGRCAFETKKFGSEHDTSITNLTVKLF